MTKVIRFSGFAMVGIAVLVMLISAGLVDGSGKYGLVVACVVSSFALLVGGVGMLIAVRELDISNQTIDELTDYISESVSEDVDYSMPNER